MKVITPEYIKDVYNDNKDNQILCKCSIFLAGTIDNGEFHDWQNELITMLSSYSLPDVIIYNPRREHWNKNASQEEQYQQIDWEQNYLDECDYIVMVIGENSKSPISLLELGQYSQSGKLVVFCNEKFYRWQNVKYVCDKEDIIVKTDLSTENICDHIIHIFKAEEIIQSLEQ